MEGEVNYACFLVLVVDLVSVGLETWSVYLLFGREQSPRLRGQTPFHTPVLHSLVCLSRDGANIFPFHLRREALGRQDSSQTVPRSQWCTLEASQGFQKI